MSHKIAVVGAGITGLITALNCARKGAEVDIYDRCHIPNKLSNSWAYARLWRIVHEDNPALEALAIRSGRFWESLMDQYGEKLIRPTKILRINNEKILTPLRLSYDRNKKTNTTTSLKQSELTSFFNIPTQNNVMTGEDGLLLRAHSIYENLLEELMKYENVKLLPNKTLFPSTNTTEFTNECAMNSYKKVLICTSSPIKSLPRNVTKKYQYHIDIELKLGHSFRDVILDMGDIHKTWCIPSLEGNLIKLSASHFSFNEPPDNKLKKDCKDYLINILKIPFSSITEQVSEYYSSENNGTSDDKLWWRDKKNRIAIMDSCNAGSYKIAPALAEDICQFAFE